MIVGEPPKESKAAEARSAHIAGMTNDDVMRSAHYQADQQKKSLTNAQKMQARINGLLKDTPNNGVVVLYFAVQDGQPVWWSVNELAHMEGFKIDPPAVGVTDRENVV